MKVLIFLITIKIIDQTTREEGSTLLELCGDLASPVTVQSYSHQLEVCHDIFKRWGPIIGWE